MSEYDELYEELEEVQENPKKMELEKVEDIKAAGSEKELAHAGSGLGGKLGESEEEYYRKKQAEAEAKGLEVAAGQYREKADAAAIYEELKKKER